MRKFVFEVCACIFCSVLFYICVWTDFIDLTWAWFCMWDFEKCIRLFMAEKCTSWWQSLMGLRWPVRLIGHWNPGASWPTVGYMTQWRYTIVQLNLPPPPSLPARYEAVSACVPCLVYTFVIQYVWFHKKGHFVAGGCGGAVVVGGVGGWRYEVLLQLKEWAYVLPLFIICKVGFTLCKLCIKLFCLFKESIKKKKKSFFF